MFSEPRHCTSAYRILLTAGFSHFLLGYFSGSITKIARRLLVGSGGIHSCALLLVELEMNSSCGCVTELG